MCTNKLTTSTGILCILCLAHGLEFVTQLFLGRAYEYEASKLKNSANSEAVNGAALYKKLF